MNLNDLGLNHIVMRNIQSRSEFCRLDVIQDSNEKLLLHPVIIPTILRSKVLPRKPLKTKIIVPIPIHVQFLKFQINIDALRILQRLEICTIVYICQIRICWQPVYLLLQNALLSFCPFHFVNKLWPIRHLLAFTPQMLKLLRT